MFAARAATQLVRKAPATIGLMFACLLLLPACTRPESRAAAQASQTLAPEVPVTATPARPGTMPTHVPPPALPTASLPEREAASSTWLYLTAFEHDRVSVVDPKSGHVLYEIPVNGQFPGVAVAPDGSRLYVIDGPSEGRLRIFDTATWQVIRQAAIADRALLLSDISLALSGDGRWLLVEHYSYPRGQAWVSVIDTHTLEFLSDDLPHLSVCPRLARVVGRPNHPESYLACGSMVVALQNDTLVPRWHGSTPSSPHPDLAVADDGKYLYGLYPSVDTRCDVVVEGEGHCRVASTDLQLLVWETATGQLVREISLSEQVFVPPATIGRGDAGYMAVAPNGERLYVAWEDRLWALSSDSLAVTRELVLPAPVDGLALSADGRELYLLPATAGDLRVRGHGLWIIDAATLTLGRHASDWPERLNLPFMIAAPASERQSDKGARDVVLATQRDHRLHVFDAATLEPLGQIAINNLAHRVSAGPDGRTLFIAQAGTPDGAGCCALFALDLETSTMCRLMEPVTEQVLSPDGRRLFAQRGNVGIEVFDAGTLARLPTIAAPGVYRLQPSPDGRWLFGITSWDGPSLDVFDLGRQRLDHRLPVPGGGGAWLGEQFHLYARDGGQAGLWIIRPETMVLGDPVPVTPTGQGLTDGQLPAHPQVVAARDRLVVYEPLGWWFKLDPRREGQPVSGGLFALDPSSGEVTGHLAPSVDFAQVVADPGGARLYGLDAGDPDGGRPVRLLALDSATGAVLAERTLPTDVWFIAPASLPDTLVPRGRIQLAACGQIEAPPPPASTAPAIAPTATSSE